MFSRIWKAMLDASAITFWAMMGASVVVTLFTVGLVLIVWVGGWPLNQAGEQLKYLGIALLCMIGLMGLVIVRLTGASLTGKFGANEIEVRAGDSPARVTTTTTVETPPKQG